MSRLHERDDHASDAADHTREFFFRETDFGAPIELAPGVHTRVLWRGSLMFSLVEIEAGAVAPIHHHQEEQMGLILEGRFDREQGGEHEVLGPGDGYYVPANVPHGGRSVDAAVRLLDVFTPPRAQHIRTEADN
jgi:quercetin dioxygenase-like cupin family protein